MPLICVDDYQSTVPLVLVPLYRMTACCVCEQLRGFCEATLAQTAVTSVMNVWGGGKCGPHRGGGANGDPNHGATCTATWLGAVIWPYVTNTYFDERRKVLLPKEGAQPAL